MPSKLKPIPELDNLPDDKRDLLHQWIEEIGYHKAIQKLHDDSGVDITYNKLYRYYQRVLHKQQLEEAEDDKLTMPDYLALLNGQPVAYDQAGIQTVMKRAFNRACVPNLKTSELTTLLRVFHYGKNCEWNDRRLAQNDKRIEISDRLAQLRSQELEWKKSSTESDSALGAPPHAARSRTRNSELKQEDDLGPFAADLEGIQRRAEAKFGKSKVAPQLESSEHSNESVAASGDSAATLQSAASLPNKTETPASGGPATPHNQTASDVCVPTNLVIQESAYSKADSAAHPAPALPNNPLIRHSNNPASQPSPLPQLPPVQQTPNPCKSASSVVKNSAPSSVNSVDSVVNPPVSVVHPIVLPTFVEINPPSLPPDSSSSAETDLERRVNDYTLARHAEVLANGPGTKLFCCPCGHKELPCPEHGDFPNEFFSARPDHPWYFSQLRSKGLPYTSPKHLIEDRARAQRKQAGLARLKQEDPDGSKMRERAKMYAIRRFRTTDGPKYGSYIPDDHAWKNQCPCGAELPCDAHDGLAAEVRHVHPLNNDYQKALAHEGIPSFVPAAIVKPTPPSQSGY